MEVNQLTIRIKEVRQETPEAFTYLVEDVSGKRIEYHPGQFITLLLQINGKEVRRSYSFSSSPKIDTDAAITIKRVANGVASRYIINHLHAGDILKCLAPAGRVFTGVEKPVLCFIAAGSGITPVYSIIRYLLQQHSAHKIFLLYQNRNEQTSIFRKELLQLAEAYPQSFEMIELFSQPNGHQLKAKRLNNYLLQQLLEQKMNLAETQFFICGPKSYMLMAEVTLRMMGVPPTAIRKEQFDIDVTPPSPPPVDTQTRSVELKYNGAVYRFAVRWPQNILQAAEANGIQLPFSCKGGRCSTCTVKLLSGEVIMSRNEVLTEKDIAEGLVLTCVGFAKTDIVISL